MFCIFNQLTFEALAFPTGEIITFNSREAANKFLDNLWNITEDEDRVHFDKLIIMERS